MSSPHIGMNTIQILCYCPVYSQQASTCMCALVYFLDSTYRFSTFRNDSLGVNEIAKELNISIDESLALMRSARLPKYTQVHL